MVPVTLMETGVVVPAVAALGETAVTAGARTMNVRPFDGTWLTESVTVIVAEPALANSVEETVAVIDVGEFPAVRLNAVVRPLKFQLTTVEVVGKLVPVRVRVTFPCPAEAEVWLRLVSTGTGLMVKVCVPGEAVEPVVTPTCAVPAVASRVEGTTAVS